MKSKHIVLFLMMCLMLVTVVSAAEWDNCKEVSDDKKEVKIKDRCLLGIDVPLVTNEIATITLDSDLQVKIDKPGYQSVANFTVNSKKDYKDALSLFEFYDKNKVGNLMDNEVNIEFDLKYFAGYKEVVHINYDKICDDNADCVRYENGTNTYLKEDWRDLITKDFKEGEILRIGIFTYVNKGDSFEWIPTIAGEKIPEWADWTSDLDATNYFKLDREAGVILDEYRLNNGTVISVTRGFAGKINNSFDFGGIGAGNTITFDQINTSFLDYTFSWWVRVEAYSDAWVIPFGSTAESTFTGRAITGDIWRWSTTTTNNDATFVLDPVINEWEMWTVTYDGTNVRFYLNSTLIDTIALARIDSLFYLEDSGDLLSANFDFNGQLDEIYVNLGTALNQTQIDALWNSSFGLEFNSTSEPPPPEYPSSVATLVLPADDLVESSDTETKSYELDCYGNNTQGIINISHVINGTVVQTATNSSAGENLSLIANQTFVAADNTWTCIVCSLQNCDTAATRAINYSLTPPPNVWTPDLNTNLSAFYEFNKTTGVVVDSTGNNDGTADSVTRGAVGIINNSFDFEAGSNNYITFPLINTSYQNWTTNFWINLESFTAGWAVPLGSEATATSFIARTSGGNFRINTVGGTNHDVATAIASTGTWEMWTITYDGTNMIVYINGTNAGQDPAIPSLSLMYFEEVGDLVGGGLEFDGRIDDLGIWVGQALNQSQVTKLYNNSFALKFNETGEAPAPTGTVTTLVLPVDDIQENSNTTTKSYELDCYANNTQGIINISHVVNGTVVQTATNTSAGENLSLIANQTFIIGVSNWTCTACSQDSCNTPTVRTINYTLTPIVPQGITIEYPTELVGYQRDNSSHGEIRVVGTYTGIVTSLEGQFNGGSWITMNNSPTNNKFIAVANFSVGNGTFIIRAGNNVSIIDSVNNIAVGEVFVTGGQSNMIGTGDNNNFYDQGLGFSSVMMENEVWKLTNDPTNSIGSGMGSVRPAIADELLPNQSVPIIFITTGNAGGSPDWAGSGTTNYDKMFNTVSTATNGTMKVKTLLFFQGETDMTNNAGGVQGDYDAMKANIFKLAKHFVSNFTSTFIMVGQVNQESTSTDRAHYDGIRKAQLDSWNENANISAGPSTFDIDVDAGSDGVHFATDDQVGNLSGRWNAAILEQVYSTKRGRGPRFVSATLTTDGSNNKTIILTVNQDNLEISDWAGTSGAIAKGFRLHTPGGILTDANIVSTTISDDTLEIVLDTDITEGSNITFGSWTDANKVAIIREDGVDKLPMEMFFNETITFLSVTMELDLVEPINAYNSTNQTITFECNATTIVGGVENVTLIIDGIDNTTATNSTPNQNITLFTSKTLNEGDHNWTCKAFAGGEFIFADETRNLSIDATLPNITFIAPANLSTIFQFNQSIQYNWTVTDNNLDSCWYQNQTFGVVTQSVELLSNDYFNFSTNNATDIPPADIAILTQFPAGSREVFDNSPDSTALGWSSPSVIDSCSGVTYQTGQRALSGNDGKYICFKLADSSIVKAKIINPLGIGNSVKLNFSSWEDVIVSCYDNTTTLNYPTSNPDNFTFKLFANDTFGNIGTDSITVLKSTTVPVITLTSPVTLYNSLTQNDSVDLNFSITNTTLLDECWYSYNGINTTVSCDSNTNFNYTTDVNTLTFFANDTFGNEGSVSVNWVVLAIIQDLIYDPIQVGTNVTTFIGVFNLTENVTGITGDLVYDGMSYAATPTLGVNQTNLTVTIDVPIFGIDTNVTFFFNITVATTNGTGVASTPSTTQLVRQLEIFNCSQGDTGEIINYTTREAITPFSLLNTAFVSTWFYRLSSGSGNIQINDSYENLSAITSSQSFCLNLWNDSVLVSNQVQVSATGFASADNFLLDANLTTDVTQQILYLLNDSLADATVLQVYDQSGFPLGNILINVQYFDIGTNSFITVTQALTSSIGSDVVYVNWLDSLYKFVLIQDGETVETTLPENIFDSPRVFTLRDENIFTFLEFQGIDYNIYYNNVTQNFVLTFAKPDGKFTEGCLRVTKKGVSGDTAICDDCSTAASATILCNIAATGNGTYIATFYATGSPAQGIDWIVQIIGGTFSTLIAEAIGAEDSTFYAFMIGLLITGIMFVNPVAGIIGIVISVYVASLLGFVLIDYLTLFGIAITGGIIAWLIRG